MTKSLPKIGKEELPHFDQEHLPKKASANITTKKEELNAFPPQSGTR